MARQQVYGKEVILNRVNILSSVAVADTCKPKPHHIELSLDSR